jgi:hypothetical protein
MSFLLEALFIKRTSGVVGAVDGVGVASVFHFFDLFG